MFTTVGVASSRPSIFAVGFMRPSVARRSSALKVGRVYAPMADSGPFTLEYP